MPNSLNKTTSLTATGCTSASNSHVKTINYYFINKLTYLHFLNITTLPDYSRRKIKRSAMNRRYKTDSQILYDPKLQPNWHGPESLVVFRVRFIQNQTNFVRMRPCTSHLPVSKVPLLGLGIGPRKTRLHRTTQTQKKCRRTGMTRVEIELTPPVFGHQKTEDVYKPYAAPAMISRKKYSRNKKKIQNSIIATCR